MKLFLFFTVCIMVYIVNGESFRFEAEDFPLSGKWKISHNKTASQGKLLFSGAKGEKNTIKAAFKIKQDATYYLWVRAFSYGQKYRTVKIKINEKTDAKSFGDEKSQDKLPSFVCSPGESYILKKGMNSISVIPMSPYSRLDLIVLTTDKNYKMPNNREQIEKLQKITPQNSQTQLSSSDMSKLPVLMFHGGRPWTGGEAAKLIRKGGLKVKVVDSTELDGLGGAPIRFHLTDKFEPKAKDGITPEFIRLNNYRAIIVCSMKRNNLEKFYSPKRIKYLEEYLKNGGTLIVTEKSPNSIKELLPVTLGGEAPKVSSKRYCLPVNKYFPNLPEKWPCFMGRRIIKAKDKTDILAFQIDENGAKQPYIAAWNIGRGKVIYINADWTRKTYFKQLRYWAYFSTLIGDLVAYGNGKSPKEIQVPSFRFAQPAVKELDKVEISLKKTFFHEASSFPAAKIKESAKSLVVKFANGVSLDFDKSSCSAKATFSEDGRTFVENIVPPQILSSGIENLNQKSSTFEAVGASSKDTKYISPKYSFKNFTLVPKGGITFKLYDKYSDALYETELKVCPKTININGKNYKGLGWSADISFSQGFIEGVRWNYCANLNGRPDEHSAWRMACYGNPRGFAKVEFDKAKSTSPWFHFGTGQPFNWLTGPDGVIFEFVDKPVVFMAEQNYSADSKNIEFSNSIMLGKKCTKIKLPVLWTLFSGNSANNENDWQSAYQFLIRRYCRQQGLKIPQPYPTAGYNNTCTEKEKQKAIKAAKQLGFKYFKLEICPAPLENLASDGLAVKYRQILDVGLEPKSWSPLGYTQGMDDPVATAHKDWLIKDRNGKVLQWFGSHPVFDLYSPGYAEHWQAICEKAIKNGLQHIYIDMGGVMPSVVNYASKSPSTQMQGMIGVFKFFAAKGVSVGIEGQNPLVLDEYWFRKNKYVNHTGKEFAFVNANIAAYATDYLTMDYFRLGMNNAFIKVNTAPYAVDFEIVPDGNAMVAEMGKLNPMFLKAIKLTGDAPFVKQTPFGTSWTGKNGAALFFWDKVKNVKLNLPAGWKIKEIFNADGKTVRYTNDRIYDVPSKSIVLVALE
jgi:hypothetical protein